MNVVALTRRCAKCGTEGPPATFVTRAGVTSGWCSTCRRDGRDAYRSSRAANGLTARPQTEHPRHMPRRLPVVDYPTDIPRPKTRAECVDGPRPCPWVSCKQHLALAVTRNEGRLDSVADSVQITFPDRELEALEETCALDVADRDGATLEDVARLMNCTRERVRQIEEKAFARIRGERGFVRGFGADAEDGRAAAEALEDFRPTGGRVESVRGAVSESAHVSTPPGQRDDEPAEEPIRIARFIEAGVHDKEWGNRVYGAYERKLVERGLIAPVKAHPRAQEILEQVEARNMGRPAGEQTTMAAEKYKQLAVNGHTPTSRELGEAMATETNKASQAFKRAVGLGLLPESATLLDGRGGRPPGGAANGTPARSPKPRPTPKPIAHAVSNGKVVSLEDALRVELERLDSRREKIEALLSDLGAA